MSETIKAAQLDSSHIGKTVRISFSGTFASEDTVVGVTHKAAMIFEGGLTEIPKWVPGRIETTITFQHLGEVDCDPGHWVTVAG